MIARKSALIVATEIINGGLAYVGLFFIARYMDPTDYGIVAFAMSFVTLFFIFSRLGYNEAHVKKISEGKKLGICNGTFFTTKIVLIMISSILIVLFIFLWKNIIGRGFESSEQEIAIYIMLGYFISNQLAESINFTFKARK